MSTWKGKTRGGLTGYRIFLFLLQNFGIKPAYGLLYFVAGYYVLFARKATAPIRQYFRTIQRFKRLKSFRYLYKNNLTFGKVLIDKVVMMSGIKNNFTFDFEGEHFLHNMAAGKGGMIIGAHIGNWEIAGHLLKRIECPVHIVMLDDEHRRIKNLLDNAMTEKKMNIIPIKDDMSHLFKIKEALQNNEIIAIHGDRFLPGSKTIECDFMGYPAKFPTGPFYIAMKYGKPISFVSSIKETNKHYHLYATLPKLYPNSGKPAIRENTIKEIITDYITELEKMLKKHPEQWFNYYYFWDI